MNEQWVLTTLAPHIVEGPSGPSVQLSENLFVDAADFASVFASATTVPITADELHAIDAGKLGYGQYIDGWKAEGLIA